MARNFGTKLLVILYQGYKILLGLTQYNDRLIDFMTNGRFPEGASGWIKLLFMGTEG